MRTAPRRAYIDPLGRESLLCVGRHCGTHTLAPTRIVHSVPFVSSAAEAAADRKLIKYASLSPSHLFVPVALETHGPFCNAAFDLFVDLGWRIAERTGDPRDRVRSSFEECLSLYSGTTQRLSMAVSAKSVLGGFETRLVL